MRVFPVFPPMIFSHSVYRPIRITNKRPPIIFLHGFMETKEVWDRVGKIVAVTKKRMAYSYDARNHGRSTHTMDSRFENNVYDLWRVMDKLDIEKAVLVGHSMGGMTAIRATLLEPSRVESLFVVNMHTDRIKRSALLKWFIYLTKEAEMICKKTDNKINLALVNHPPHKHELEKDEVLHNSVKVFRYLALSDALHIYDALPSSSDLEGVYEGPTYFYYGPRTLLCGRREYTTNVIDYFPNVCILGDTSFKNDIFGGDHLIHSLCTFIR